MTSQQTASATMSHMENMVTIMINESRYLAAHYLRVSDGTGLMPALYSYTVSGLSAPEARKQFGLQYQRNGALPGRLKNREADFDRYVAKYPK